jgi:hypothetical protein
MIFRNQELCIFWLPVSKESGPQQQDGDGDGDGDGELQFLSIFRGPSPFEGFGIAGPSGVFSAALSTKSAKIS